MRHTFIKPALAAAIASILQTSFAAVAPRQAMPSGGAFTCVDDALFKGFFSNTQISYDVQTFCSSELGLTDSTVCDHSLTTRTTVYPSASYQTITTTSTTTSYDSTVTVTETGAVVLDMSKKRMARNAALRPEAQITEAPQIVRKALDARALEKRQSTTMYNANSAAAQVYSACKCGYFAGIITPETDYVATCFPYTSTVTNNRNVYQATTTTAVTTVEGALTTITLVQNVTSNIISVISAMNTSTPTWTSPWTGPWSDSWTGPWTEDSGLPTVSSTPMSNTTPSSPATTSLTDSMTLTTSVASSSVSPSSTWTGSYGGNWSTSEFTSTSSSTNTEISPYMPSTSTPSTWTGTWTGNWFTSDSTSTSSSMPSTTTPNNGTSIISTALSPSPTIQPSGCPYINGTTYQSPNSCNIYTRVCGLSFPDADFYGTFPYYPSPELCAGLCDADSNGMSPCLGVVWNTSAMAGSHQSNCRQLQSLENPIMDSTAVALILTGQDPSCNKVVNITSSILSSPTLMLVSMNSTIKTVSPTGTSNMSYNAPSGTGYSWLPTGTRNYTWLPTGTWNYTRSGPTGSYSRNHTYSHSQPINSTTMNPYMPSTTSYSNLNTSMNSTSMSSMRYMNATSSGTTPISLIMPSISSCPISTVTQYWGNTTAVAPVTIYATNIKIVTITATEKTTETDSYITTETDVLTTTEKDTLTITETDTKTKTKIHVFTITETDTFTTTETDVSTTTETDISTTTTTVAATPPGRYAWHGVW